MIHETHISPLNGNMSNIVQNNSKKLKRVQRALTDAELAERAERVLWDSYIEDVIEIWRSNKSCGMINTQSISIEISAIKLDKRCVKSCHHTLCLSLIHISEPTRPY